MANTPTREHREAALALLYNRPVDSELKWLESGQTPDESHEGIARAERVAQAICDAEQLGYERGLKDTAAIASYGKHLAKEE